MGSSNSDNSFIEKGIDAVSNFFTLGTVGYQSGKGLSTDEGMWKKAGEAGLKGLKDVTGATAMEQANKDAQAQIANAKAEAEAQRKQALDDTARDSMAKSRLAGSARATNVNTNANSSTMKASSKLGSDERDFLGI